jgi:hypothetical protein
MGTKTKQQLWTLAQQKHLREIAQDLKARGIPSARAAHMAETGLPAKAIKSMPVIGDVARHHRQLGFLVEEVKG